MSKSKIFFVLALAGALVACGDDPVDPGVDAFVPEVDGGTDGGGGGDEDGGPVDGGGGGGSCATYCTQLMTNCSGDNAQYGSEAECLAYCASSGWPEGAVGATSGNSIQCRIYHGGAPATAGPAEHCPHAGPTGAGVCGAAITFRTDAPAAYTRVDRMGMPAVSTALVPSAQKNAYNDASLADDVAGTFAGFMITTLEGIHDVLDDDLTAAGLTPCDMEVTENGLPQCLGQNIAAGVTVASLVLPDAVHIDPSAAAGFPNGRMLTDPVIDVTLSVILLDMGGSCGPSVTCGPTTLFNGPTPAPINPPANDVAFGTTFPYLAPAHAP